MNKKRSGVLATLHDRLADIKDTLEEVQQEEQDAFDNLPENFRKSGKGLDMRENADRLYEAVSYLERAMKLLKEVKRET